MDGRLSLFNNTKRMIETKVPEVQHVDLYNENVEYVDEECPWERPAVFIEFGDIEWRPFTGTKLSQRGEGELRLHIVTDWAEGGFEAAYYLTNKVLDALMGSGADAEVYTVFCPHTTMTCRSHGELMENIEVMQVKYLRTIR